MMARAYATDLAFDILKNDFHKPLIDGKANIDAIEDAITVAIYAGDLGPVSQEEVLMAIDLVNDMIKLYKTKK
jgi:hypothetical protein